MALRDTVGGIIAVRLGSALTENQRIDLERGIFNATLKEATARGVRRHWENPDFAEIYRAVARKAVGNLDPTSYVGNPRLLERLKEGEFAPHDVPFMTAREMYPEHWQKLTEEQLKRESTMLEGSAEEGSDMFKCNRCGKSRTKYWEI